MFFSIPWSIGGVIDVDGREKFDKYYRDLLSGKFEEHPIPKVLTKLDAPMPETGLVYDYCFEVCIKIISTKFNW